MKSTKSAFAHNPFGNLRKMIQERSIELPDDCHDRENISYSDEADPIEDEKLFLEAMEGITPIVQDGMVDVRIVSTGGDGIRKSGDDEVISQLKNLVNRGEGFIVADTPEYVEGTGYCVRRDVAKRLHRGEFSIQSHIDLHGLTAEEAKTAFEKFLKESVMTGKRAVLVIHGRGRSSPSEPVIKNKVVDWLTGGPWRKWVMAFSSARRCDGGAGATYVLLRERPLTKRYRRLNTKRKKQNT